MIENGEFGLEAERVDFARLNRRDVPDPVPACALEFEGVHTDRPTTRLRMEHSTLATVSWL